MSRKEGRVQAQGAWGFLELWPDHTVFPGLGWEKEAVSSSHILRGPTWKLRVLGSSPPTPSFAFLLWGGPSTLQYCRLANPRAPRGGDFEQATRGGQPSGRGCVWGRGTGWGSSRVVKRGQYGGPCPGQRGALSKGRSVPIRSLPQGQGLPTWVEQPLGETWGIGAMQDSQKFQFHPRAGVEPGPARETVGTRERAFFPAGALQR